MCVCVCVCVFVYVCVCIFVCVDVLVCFVGMAVIEYTCVQGFRIMKPSHFHE